jgi:hypothetical protein
VNAKLYGHEGGDSTRPEAVALAREDIERNGDGEEYEVDDLVDDDDDELTRTKVSGQMGRR